MPDKLENHRFWSQQPVSEPADKVKVEVNGPVNPDWDLTQTPKTPTTLPPGFDWCVIDVKDPKAMLELYEFLNDNYVEDSSSGFKLHYPANVLYWALVQPGYIPETIIGVRQGNGPLLATIAATPDTFNIRGKTVNLVIVDFLCVHQSMRSKRMSPVLIKEVTRIVNLRGIPYAFHTGSIDLPTCLSAPM
ncbi:Glycylpeptide N-tetradecanoyltransferase [Thelohanellus kitauei]|uniref:glycylpeptide N-tetradecanoyltransferase n=1 Tax=Thelohanellus kitauei TaxID=669202 RepID=A0A0C2NEH0_THEKT|nr:Glycylpeptide N-tetradecanoyltransferase [Thelohanellus kitauei]